MENEFQKLTITQWAENDKPREKLLAKGSKALSDAELLAIILGSGTTKKTAVELAQEILATANNNLNSLASFTLNDLKKHKGVGEAKGINIIACLELGRRRKEATTLEKPKITCSKDAYILLQEHLHDLPHEEFWIINLTRSNQVINIRQISKGGVTGTVVDAKIVFKTAIDNNAVAVIISHNHPSGNNKPSNEDIKLTSKLREAGKVLDIPILDHVIYTNNGYYSFADEGI